MKKLSDMTPDQRMEHWVHQHTMNVVGDIGSTRALKSANRLVDKVLDEMCKQYHRGVSDGRKSTADGWVPPLPVKHYFSN